MDPYQGFFTSIQAAKLQKSGFKSLYDFITFEPIRFEQISPLRTVHINHHGDEVSPDLFLVEGTLQNFKIVRAGKNYIILDLMVANLGCIQAYLFSLPKYAYHTLKSGGSYQALLKPNKGLWSVTKITSISKKEKTAHGFILGRALLQDYFIPVYEKRREITTGLCNQLHRRLPKAAYTLNLEGLVPSNQIIPQRISLYGLHHITNIHQFSITKRKWLSLQVYLKLVLLKFVHTNQQGQAIRSQFDSSYYNQLIESLPFTLSPSQTSVVEALISHLTTKNNP